MNWCLDAINNGCDAGEVRERLDKREQREGACLEARVSAKDVLIGHKVHGSIDEATRAMFDSSIRPTPAVC